MPKQCITSQGYTKETDKFYVNIKDKAGIATAKELFKVCIECHNFLQCEKKKDLILVLMLNELGQQE